MIAVVPAHDVTGRWRLVSRTDAGADVLAIANAGQDMPGRSALQRLRVGDGMVSVVRVDDAYFHWALTDTDGRVIVESPAVYRRPETCRQAFIDEQRAARTALDDVSAQPSARCGDRPTPGPAVTDITHPDRRRS